ncbi:MAG TPA: hypothetical protein VGG02_00650 [Chthoniobacterales bacterium]
MVKTALAFAGRMQWHRYDTIKAPPGDSRIFQRLGEPATDEPAQRQLSAVFKTMNDFADIAAASIAGNRGFKMKIAVRAIFAVKRADDRSVKGL